MCQGIPDAGSSSNRPRRLDIDPWNLQQQLLVVSEWIHTYNWDHYHRNCFFLMGDHTDLTFLELVEAKIAETPQGKCHGFNCRFSQETNQLKPQYDNPHYNPMKSTGFTMMISQHPNEMQP